MSQDEQALGANARLQGQARVYRAWRDRLRGRSFPLKDELGPATMLGELAHVSILEQVDRCFRFRLAGSGLRLTFAREARGVCLHEFEICEGDKAWADAAQRALDTLMPVAGRSITSDGRVHFWLRLPISSDGKAADLVLCHDRFLPLDAQQDPEAAAKVADKALRLDAEAVPA